MREITKFYILQRYEDLTNRWYTFDRFSDREPAARHLNKLREISPRERLRLAREIVQKDTVAEPNA